MGLIESEEAAKRLARVIVSDIEIYNREKFQAGADLTAAIEEGRALFRSRVAPELMPLFTSVLEDRRVANRRRPEAKPAPAPAEAAPPRPAAKAAPPEVTEPPAPARHVAPPAPALAAPGMTAAAQPEPVASTAPPAAEPVVAEDAPAPHVTPAPAPSAPAPAPAFAVAAVAVAAPAAAAPAAARPATGSRGPIIETEEAAARLARVILSDIELYNAKKIAAGSDLTYEIEEGRGLFRARVKPELLPLFESTLASKGVGQRKRSAAPAPVKPAAPAHVEPAPPVAAAPPAPAPVPMAAAPTPTPSPVAAPRPAAPAVAARPAISAAKAPPAAQPRPGLAVPPRRPTPAPLAVPSLIAETGSGRHAAHTNRPGMSFEAPAQDETPTPGAMAGMAIGSTPPPSDAVYASPRNTGSRPAAMPPAVPPAARHTGQPMRVATPVPHAHAPRRDRAPSSPELPISVDSGPHQLSHHADPAHVQLPPQSVLDALPAPAPLPPLPVGGGLPYPAHTAHSPLPLELHGPTPASLPHPTAPARIATPASLPHLAPLTDLIAPVPDGEEVVSLRRRMSKARLVLTLAALGGAGGAIWYFFLR